MAQLVKNLSGNVGDARDVGSIPGSRTSPREFLEIKTNPCPSGAEKLHNT